MNLTQYDQGMSCGPKEAIYHQPTLTERLQSQKAELERQLEKVNEALDSLKENPKLQTLFEAISRV
ncbi:MAG: hypothetical protein ABIJ26_03585 [Candidatus Margulisiibacteriota bacterium]